MNQHASNTNFCNAKVRVRLTAALSLASSIGRVDRDACFVVSLIDERFAFEAEPDDLAQNVLHQVWGGFWLCCIKVSIHIQTWHEMLKELLSQIHSHQRLWLQNR